MTVQPVIPPSWLPADLELGPLLGEGRRSQVFAAHWQEEAVVVKRYREATVRKYRRKYGVSIARFEYERNLAFWEQGELRPNVPRPIGVCATAGRDVELFIQQRVDGCRPQELVGRDGRLPAGILQAIDRVVDLASAHCLYDIDMSPSNFVLQREGHGWRPLLFDFNLMPQHLCAPNPLVALLYRIGVRHPAHRDRWMLRRLRTWPD